MKRRMIKRFISLFLMVLLTASFLPVCVLAAETGWHGPGPVNAREENWHFLYSDVWINIHYNNGNYSSQDAISEDSQKTGITWTSSDKNIASVDQDGNVALCRPGDAQITATRQDDDYSLGSYQLHIYRINIGQSDMKMNLGDITRNDVSLEPAEYNLDLAYLSEDENVVTVDRDGTLHAVGEGTATVKVHVSGSQTFDTFTVEVTDPEKVLPGNEDGSTDPTVPGGEGPDTEAPFPGDDGPGTDMTTPSVGQTEPAVQDLVQTKVYSLVTVTETADSRETVTAVKTTSRSTVTKTQSSSGKSTIARKTSGNAGQAVNEDHTEPVHTADTAAVINEPSVPTAAYISPADGGNGGLPGSDNMASHAGAVAGMLAAAAAVGAVGVVKAYKLK